MDQAELSATLDNYRDDLTAKVRSIDTLCMIMRQIEKTAGEAIKQNEYGNDNTVHRLLEVIEGMSKAAAEKWGEA